MAIVRVGGRLLGIEDKCNPQTIERANQVLADAAAHRRPASDEGTDWHATCWTG
ncbi:hypothetical protein ACFVQ0_28150 [Streptomyces sp. NPDC057900]|uniref:hypothetical protein n=1 Tax=Streptomyces sp. NPDC057900 TaxID=3346274 RepID=UPI0036F04B77